MIQKRGSPKCQHRRDANSSNLTGVTAPYRYPSLLQLTGKRECVFPALDMPNQFTFSELECSPGAGPRDAGSRCKYDTFDPSACKLVVKGIAETACLITTFNRIFIVRTEFPLRGFNEADDFFVVRGDLYFPKDSVFCPDGGFHCT